MSFIALALACARDTDGDGLEDRAEREFGTDPLRADTDEDGWDDRLEAAWGSDPTNPDTDGDLLVDGLEDDYGTGLLRPDTDEDGYLDGWEALEGSVPTDDRSLIYAGGWPYNPNKDLLDGTYPRVVGLDQHGDVVDLYDFAGAHRTVVQNASIAEAPFHASVISWVDGTLSDFAGLDQQVRTKVDNGEIQWVVVLVDTAGIGADASGGFWDFLAQSTGPAKLGDPDGLGEATREDFGMPAFLVVDENFDVVSSGAVAVVNALASDTTD